MKKNFLLTKIKSISIISPNKEIIQKIRLAFILVKKVDLKEYNKIFSRLKIIFITNKNGYTNEFFMPEKIWFVNKSVINKNDLNWLASLIIHEAFHATQFKNGKYILPLYKLEKPALDLQKKFLKKLEKEKGVKDIKKVSNQKYWQKMAGDKNSFTYFRNLLNLLENKNLKFNKIL